MLNKLLKRYFLGGPWNEWIQKGEEYNLVGLIYGFRKRKKTPCWNSFYASAEICQITEKSPKIFNTSIANLNNYG